MLYHAALLRTAIRDIVRHRRTYDRPPVRPQLAFKLGHGACLMAALLTTALRLRGTIPSTISWVRVLVPLWWDAAVGGLLLGLAAVGAMSMAGGDSSENRSQYGQVLITWLCYLILQRDLLHATVHI
jgi:hypothetical protein